jgi:uncharacterized protein Smg (DUF494 family)
MSERILEIVIFLMDYMRSEQDRFADSDDFSGTLRNMGYSDNEISSAYFWLMNRFDNAPEEIFADFPMMHHAIRILSQEERMQLDTGAYGLLLKLHNLALIDDEDLETILERVNIFGAEPVSKEQIKMVASSIVFGDFNDMGDFDALTTKAGRSTLVN